MEVAHNKRKRLKLFTGYTNVFYIYGHILVHNIIYYPCQNSHIYEVIYDEWEDF